MTTPLGWSVPIDAKTKQNFLLNFPIQGAGADILRAAAGVHKSHESVEKLGAERILFAVTIPCRATGYSMEEPRR
jgi:hypothetical protein